MNLQETIKRILREDKSKKDFIKSILFQILNVSDYVQKFDYIWSPNSSVGVEPIFVTNLSEKDFYNQKINLFDLIGELWPYGENDYDEWKELYYGLVYGYLIKDKDSDTKIIIQIIRFEEGFQIYINPNYKGEKKGEKIYIDDEIINVFNSNEDEYSENDFSILGDKLKNNVDSVDDVKFLFNYLDAII